MSYTVKEVYYTLQGEGANTGRPAVFCRFAGCNLWSGHERDRSQAICRFCDTDFVGTNGLNGGVYSAQALVRTLGAVGLGCRFVVFTGGEPLLQLNSPLTALVHAAGFEIAVETNGTLLVPSGVDWVCVSPKANAPLVQRTGDELKLVYPQVGIEPRDVEHLDFRHWFLQPMDGPAREHNTRVALQHCLEHPRWRLSLQTHKLLGIA